MRSIDLEDWEDDEPPMLGEDTDNQAADASRKPQDASVMDEMFAVAQRAKEDKRKQQESERNRKSFGQGLKKGFFNTKAKPTKEKTARSTSSVLEPTRQQARDERLLIVKEKQEEAATTSPTFVFPEVQEAMKSMNQLDPKEWMNERFFEKLARNPRLAQALQNPAFSTAITEMQQDPQAAVLKYQKDPAVSTMLRDFMEFLGNHFEELGASEEAASPQRSATQRQQAVGRDLRVDNKNQTPSAASTPPAIVDLDETRRQAIAGMQRTPEEEEQVQRILKNPELLEALSDGSLMQRLHACQQSPGELQRLAQDPVLGPKLRLLVQHNMVQFSA